MHPFNTRLIVLGGLVVGLWSAALPTPAEAQGSYGACKPICFEACGSGKFMGIGSVRYGPVARICQGGGCVACGGEEEFAQGPSIEEILSGVHAAVSAEELAALATTYGNRILIVPSRGMIVGLDGCSEDSMMPVSIVPIEDWQVRALVGIGLTGVEEFASPQYTVAEPEL